MRRLAWVAGWPVRATLVAAIRGYRVTLGYVVGGGCRFYPSCSAYAEEAIRGLGALRGGALAGWRLLRCSPLSKGGVDYPPTRERGCAARAGACASMYDDSIQRASWEAGGEGA